MYYNFVKITLKVPVSACEKLSAAGSLNESSRLRINITLIYKEYLLYMAIYLYSKPAVDIVFICVLHTKK